MADYAKILVQIKWAESEIARLKPRYDFLSVYRDSKQKRVSVKYPLVKDVKALANIEQEIKELHPKLINLKASIDDLLTWGKHDVMGGDNENK